MISVLNKAADVLELLADSAGRPRPLGEIATTLDLRPATCANILKTLVARGLVDQQAPRKGYALGPMVHWLASRGTHRKDLVSAAEPWVRHLADRVGETVLLAILRQDRRYVLCQADGQRELTVRPDRTGSDVYSSATGRLLLAHLPAEELEGLLQRRGLPGPAWPEAADRPALDSALAAIRRRGIIVYRHHQVVGIAVPIGGGRPAVLGLFLPAVRFRGRHKQQVLAGLRETAAAIDATLGRSHGD